jgi:hypothetical protein
MHSKKDRAMAQRDIEGLIKAGDELFKRVSRRGQEVSWDDVKRLVMGILWECNINITSDDEFDDDESSTFDESSCDEEEDSDGCC